MVGIMVASPAGRKIKLLIRTIAGSLTSGETIRFLKELKRHLRGHKLLLIWDGLPIHRSRDVSRHLVQQRAWLRVERFPAYAPELNPIEYCWSALKTKRLGNLRAVGMPALGLAVRRAKRALNDRAVLYGFLKASGLY